MNILLDYFFPISVITPTPQASTSFLKQACLVVKPASMVTTGVITPCTTMAAVSALTNNTDAQQLFNAGMAKVFILPMNDLDLAAALVGHESDFFTVLISSDWNAADITETKATGTITVSSYANLVSGTADKVTIAGVDFTAQSGAATPGDATFQAATSNNATAASLAAQINAHATVGALVTATPSTNTVGLTAKGNGSEGDVTLVYTDNDTNVGITLSGLSGGKLAGGDGLFLGQFVGVTGVWETDETFLKAQAAIENRCAFHSTSSNKAKNLCFAFGKLLSNALDWTNQQYVTMAVADDVDNLGDAETYFDDKVSFVINDDQYGSRLALFACGGKAIVAPYIERNLEIDLQSSALSYISGNEPSYTKKQAALLEDELNKVILSYINDKQWLDAGTIAITLEEDNFVAAGNINIAEPKALWRIFGEMRQTL